MPGELDPISEALGRLAAVAEELKTNNVAVWAELRMIRADMARLISARDRSIGVILGLSLAGGAVSSFAAKLLPAIFR